MQDDASGRDGDRGLRLVGADSNPCDGADLREGVRSGAGEGEKATYWTRTSDLSFTKAPLYQLS